MVFYPADFTFVCPTELEEVADLYPKFQAAGAEVISVSTDTAFVHKAWHDNSPAIAKVNYPMGADPTGEVSRLFDVYIDKDGLALRGTFIIDPDGILKTAEIHDLGIGRSAEEALRKLEAARFVFEHGDQVCPANWQPGSDTLTPGLDLVGKI
jgi:peroxiredoxin (alkyl hydroperoxide reductase subunit C)